MLDIFRNPEFIRHARAELRAPRMMLSGGLALVMCFLISMFHSQATNTAGRVYADGTTPPVTQTLYFWLLSVQCIVLPLWCLSSSLQAIAGERQMKTYDFVRTTRMTSTEILLGYLFGAPLMAYFTVAVSAVVAFLSGLGERVPIGAMIATYILLFVFSVFISLCGLLVSMVIEKPRAAGMLFILLFFGTGPMTAIGFSVAASPFPGLAALGLLPGLLPLYNPLGNHPISAPFFGAQIPYLALSVALYASIGAWLVIALVRNLKREREEIQLLTRVQALGFAAYLNFLFLGFLNPKAPDYFFRNEGLVPAVMLGFLLMNQTLFYIVGLTTLVPAERLKIWYRELLAKQKSYLAEEGLAWPWMLIAGGTAYIGVVLCGIVIQSVAQRTWSPGALLISVLVLLVFAIRDVLFLQWCLLTRMKSPLGKGIGLLWLYYFAAFVVSGFFSGAMWRSGRNAPGIFAFLTPVGAWAPSNVDGVVAGLLFQIIVCGGLLYLIRERLTQMQLVTASSAS
jgi:hypothetical protein